MHIRIPMPLKAHHPHPPEGKDWRAAKCPVCGADCWEHVRAADIKAQNPSVELVCVACATESSGRGESA